jgi:hypothetical protein
MFSFYFLFFIFSFTFFLLIFLFYLSSPFPLFSTITAPPLSIRSLQPHDLSPMRARPAAVSSPPGSAAPPRHPPCRRSPPVRASSSAAPRGAHPSAMVAVRRGARQPAMEEARAELVCHRSHLLRPPPPVSSSPRPRCHRPPAPPRPRRRPPLAAAPPSRLCAVPQRAPPGAVLATGARSGRRSGEAGFSRFLSAELL